MKLVTSPKFSLRISLTPDAAAPVKPSAEGISTDPRFTAAAASVLPHGDPLCHDAVCCSEGLNRVLEDGGDVASATGAATAGTALGAVA